MPRAAHFLNEQLGPLLIGENHHNSTSNLGPASFIQGTPLPGSPSTWLPTGWGQPQSKEAGHEGGGKACPLLGPIQSGPGLSLLRTGPRGPASWPPGSRPASPFPPPSGHTGLFLLLWHAAAFSLDSRKSGSFLSFGAPLKHHLGEVLSGHSPLLAHPFVIYPEATNSPRPMLH